MLRAYLQNKLGRALSAAGVEDRRIRRELARSEDALTSSVLARVRYLPNVLQWGLLTGAGPRPLGAEPWPERPPGEPTWEFWPSFDPAPGFGKERVEPDVVVRWGGNVVILEAKQHGAQYDWQWACQVRAVLAETGADESRLIFVAVGGTRTEEARAVAKDAAARAGTTRVRFFQLDWPALHTSVTRLAARNTLHAGERAILADVAEALEAAGRYGERGWAPLQELARASRDLPPPAIYRWSRL